MIGAKPRRKRNQMNENERKNEPKLQVCPDAEAPTPTAGPAWICKTAEIALAR